MKVIQLHATDEKLIARAVKQDRRAQKKLYERHAPRMLSVCRQYVKDLALAEELMNNGFLKAFDHLSEFDERGVFAGWLRRIMTRECIDHLRKKIDFRWPQELNEDLIPDTVEEELEVPSLEILQQAIDKLPSGYRAVFVLYAIDGLKHTEIAEYLDIATGTSKSQYRKARLMLQDSLKKFKKHSYEA